MTKKDTSGKSTISSELSEKLDYISHVVGTTARHEHELLIKYAQQVPKNGVVVDIGTCGGRSAFALAVGCKPSVKVYTIDLAVHPRFWEHAEKLGLKGKIKHLTGGTEAHRDVWDKKIDLIFHDAVHTHWAVKHDIEGWAKHLKKGGHFIFHDYKLYDSTVGAAIKEGEKEGYYEKVDIIENIYIGRR